MITKTELIQFAKLKNLNLGNTEKDYLLDMALLSISKNTKNELIFKGGTCLYKFHKLNRFSEDLDFSVTSSVNVNQLMKSLLSDFAKFGIHASEHERREPFNSILITVRVEGPLFTGNPTSYASLGIDINLKSSVIKTPELYMYTSSYPDLTTIAMQCMAAEEIFAEKIRALMTRKRTRDLFDLHFLLKLNKAANRELIDQKLDYYKEPFDLEKLLARLKDLEQQWKRELQGFVSELSNFKEVEAEVSTALKELYG